MQEKEALDINTMHLVKTNQNASVYDDYNTYIDSSKIPPKTSWDNIFLARKMFHSGDVSHINSVSPHIYRSWKRSRKSNVPVNALPATLVSHKKFLEIQQENALLIDVSSKITNDLYENIIPFKNCIILTDNQGVYLYTLGGGDGFGMGATCPVRGLVSRESIDGTTSMGICLEEKVPTTVLGCEHYNPHYDGWACTSAPIFNHDGTLVGTLTLTLERDKFHQHTFGLVIAAAQGISEQLRLHQLYDQSQTIMDLLDEALFILAPDGTVQTMNRQAHCIFQGHTIPVGRKLAEIFPDSGIQAMLTQDAEGKTQNMTLRLPDGPPVRCKVSISRTRGGQWCLAIRDIRTAAQNRGQLESRNAGTFAGIIRKSETMEDAVDLARMAGANDMPTLILGESGVGKELFAQAIHHDGSRRGHPFVAINCGAIPSELIQSELFGYEPGAFTGAGNRGAQGKFEQADQGTIFLDEIGDMPLAAQASLLRVLQNGEVTRLGGKKSVKIDARIIAATHRPLWEAVQKGTFRQDLFYRLHVITIPVPPLRERRSDIMPLALHFLEKVARILGKTIRGFSPDAQFILENADWPGNVRQLENAVKRAAVVATADAITGADLPYEVQHPGHNAPAPALAAGHTDSHAQHLRNVLQTTCGNVQEAARILGISRVTAYKHIRRYAIDLDTMRNSQK